jgi:hypothetical protein
VVVRRDTVLNKPPVVLQKGKAQKADSSVKKPAVTAPTPFRFNPGDVHYAVIVLNKMDIVFTNETKNAFNRYNREKFYNKTYDLVTLPIDPENSLLLIKQFDSASAAVNYVQLVKKVSYSEIVPWLKPEKYSFGVISESNLQILQANHDLAAYRRFLDQYLPGKF